MDFHPLIATLLNRPDLRPRPGRHSAAGGGRRAARAPRQQSRGRLEGRHLGPGVCPAEREDPLPEAARRRYSEIRYAGRGGVWSPGCVGQWGMGLVGWGGGRAPFSRLTMAPGVLFNMVLCVVAWRKNMKSLVS